MSLISMINCFFMGRGSWVLIHEFYKCFIGVVLKNWFLFNCIATTLTYWIQIWVCSFWIICVSKKWMGETINGKTRKCKIQWHDSSWLPSPKPPFNPLEIGLETAIFIVSVGKWKSPPGTKKQDQTGGFLKKKKNLLPSKWLLLKVYGTVSPFVRCVNVPCQGWCLILHG